MDGSPCAPSSSDESLAFCSTAFAPPAFLLIGVLSSSALLPAFALAAFWSAMLNRVRDVLEGVLAAQ
eukprot:3464976-Pleurochrysis_carterae.AAC.1